MMPGDLWLTKLRYFIIDQLLHLAVIVGCWWMVFRDEDPWTSSPIAEYGRAWMDRLGGIRLCDQSGGYPYRSVDQPMEQEDR
jgi:hypothetical protein